jgi:hypothetical protein
VPRERPAAQRERMLREGAEAWARLRALLDAARDRERVHAGGEAAWRAGDVYAHFARYQSLAIDQVARALAGREPLPPDGLDDDTRNERWAAEDRALTFQEARTWCLTMTAALRAQLLRLTPRQWADFGARYAEDVLAPHYEAHIRYIETGE